METSAGIAASLSGRYATALFDLAREQDAIAAVEASMAKLAQTLADVADFRALTTSPLIDRKVAGAAVTAVGDSLGVDPLTANFLKVLAENRRLAALPAIIRDVGVLAAAHRGEVAAEVTSAHPLSDDQLDALKKQLRARVGRDVAVTTRIDPAILGGLVVRIGSRIIDASIKTRLNTLAHAMKG